MNKFNLAGTILAAALLAVALAAKLAGGSPAVILPLLSVGVWILMAVDTVGYRRAKDSGITKNISFARLVSGYIIAVLVSAGTVIYLIFR